MPDPNLMPYMTEKSVYLSLCDTRYSGTIGDRKRLLKWLRDDANYPGNTDGEPGGGAKQATLMSPVLDASSGLGAQARIEHLNRDWLGLEPEPSAPTGWRVKPGVRTGWWKYWKGDAEKIMRMAFIRALEVSMGVDHGAPLSGMKAKRQWFIDFLWTCPHPRFEAWVSWRQTGKTRKAGQVTVLLQTPGMDGSKLTPRLSRPGFTSQSNPNYHLNPTSAPNERGLWVIGHDETEVVEVKPSEASAEGEWSGPGTVHVGKGPVVTVEPAIAEGGTPPDGTPWIKV